MVRPRPSTKQRSARRIETITTMAMLYFSVTSTKQRSARRIETAQTAQTAQTVSALQPNRDPHGGLKHFFVSFMFFPFVASTKQRSARRIETVMYFWPHSA